jgi:hypothetical protein
MRIQTLGHLQATASYQWAGHGSQWSSHTVAAKGHREPHGLVDDATLARQGDSCGASCDAAADMDRTIY